MSRDRKPLSRYKGKNRCGKWFEKEVVNPALEALEKKNSAFQHRFVDSAEAGNTVRGQPSDNLLVINGKTILIEAKASEAKASFNKSMLQPAQVSGLYRMKRAGGEALILFWHDGYIDVLDGGAVAEKVVNGEKAAISSVTLATIKDTGLEEFLRCCYE